MAEVCVTPVIHDATMPGPVRCERLNRSTVPRVIALVHVPSTASAYGIPRKMSYHSTGFMGDG